jgi:hypothetical protein
MKTHSLFIALLAFTAAFANSPGIFACNCGGALSPWTKEEADGYDVIFLGRIDSIYGDHICSARFHGISLFKGLAPKNAVIRHDCYSTCRMPFEPGQIWLIYAHIDSTGYWVVDYCGRSRPKPVGGEPDEHAGEAGLSYADELGLVRKSFPPRDFITQKQIDEISDSGKKVIDPMRELPIATPGQKVVLVIISFAGLIFFYVLVRRFMK